MENQILQKVWDNLRSRPSEASVGQLFTLLRKLLERLPRAERQGFALLNFYCDWTLHTEIDRSDAAAEILVRAHEILADHLARTDNSTFSDDLTAALSLEAAREQANALVTRFGGPPSLLTETFWAEALPPFLEIVSHSPLRFGRKRKLQAALQPLKGKNVTWVTEELMVQKVPASTFFPEKPAHMQMYCLTLVASDTTRIITPLAPVRG